jgi:hypothetical protein
MVRNVQVYHQFQIVHGNTFGSTLSNLAHQRVLEKAKHGMLESLGLFSKAHGRIVVDTSEALSLRLQSNHNS